jgi:hypothetical protein
MKLLALLAVLLPCAASAATITWQNPTTYSDGSFA